MIQNSPAFRGFRSTPARMPRKPIPFCIAALTLAAALGAAERTGEAAAPTPQREPPGLLRRALRIHRPLWSADKDGQRFDIAVRCGVRVLDGAAAWSPDELEKLAAAMAVLPESFRNLPLLTSIRREPSLRGVIHGRRRPLRGGYSRAQKAIIINDSCFRSSDRFPGMDDFTATLIHEWTHAFNWQDPRTGEIYEDWLDNPLMRRYMDVSGPWERRRPLMGDIGRFYAPGRNAPEDVIAGGAEVWIFSGKEALTPYSLCSPQEHLSDTAVFVLLAPQEAERHAPRCAAAVKELILAPEKRPASCEARGR